MFHIGTNNWQREGEFAPGSGILHASMHQTFNSIAGVKCYSIYPSKIQTNPKDDDTFRIFKLEHDIPICESVSPNSSYRWHSMNDEQFTAYRKRLEDEVCQFMDEVEKKEKKEFDYIISHHAFTNAMTAAQVVRRRNATSKKKLKHFNFVHGTALKMYIKEKDGDPEYPMRFLKVTQDHGVFSDRNACSGIWVNSEDYIGKFLDCFPKYPKSHCVFSRIGVNQKIFCPKGTKVADLDKHLRDADKGKLSDIKKVVTFVGKFADWKRLDAVLYAAKKYEETLPDVATMIVGSGPAEAITLYEGLAEKLGLKRTFFLGPKGQDVLAELFSASEVGMFPSYKEPFGMVFIECMACGTPTIGAKSGGPTEIITDEIGCLIPEVDNWREEAGAMELGASLAEQVTKAINEDWKGKTKGKKCVPFVSASYSTMAQCTDMLKNMEEWSKPPTLMFHLGTNNWQRQGEFAPGSGILHASMHQTFNSMPGIKCYSIYPSKIQTNPEDDDTFKIFKLEHDIPICESVSPNSSYRWHSMNDEQFTAYRKRLENEVCAYMDDIEEKEGVEFEYLVSHHAFTNAMTGAQIVERRHKEGKKNLKHYNFVHGTALKMYIKEKDGDPEYPMRFLKVTQDHGVFNSRKPTKGIWVNSEDYITKFLDCFPKYPKSHVVFSRIGVNQQIFCPKGTTVPDLEAHLRDGDKGKLGSIKRVVTFVGKFADWKRLDAVLYAAKKYEAEFPDLGTMIVGSGPPEAIELYEGLATKLGLERTFFLGPKGQDVLAQLFSASELGMFPSYKEPFGMVFIECMACGTPTLGAKSGGPTEFITDEVGVLIPEVDNWREEAGAAQLGDGLAAQVSLALKEDWKGKTKGPNCVSFVASNYSTTAQCSSMLENMKDWAK